MHLKKILAIHVLYRDEEVSSMEGMGISTKDYEYPTREAYFLTIDTISPASLETEFSKCNIGVGGDLFQVEMSAKSLIEKLEKEEYI